MSRLPNPKTMRFGAIYLTALLLLLTACAGAPVQEMSNARQAVAAAEQAGAAKCAPEQLTQARYLLQQAQIALDHAEYRQARENATHAREEAVKANRICQGLDEQASPQP